MKTKMKFERTTFKKYLFQQCSIQGLINCGINFIVGWLLYVKRRQISSTAVLVDLVVMTLISVFIIYRFQHRTAKNDGFDNRVILSQFFKINPKYVLNSRILDNDILEGSLLSIFLAGLIGGAFFIIIRYWQNGLLVLGWVLLLRCLVAFTVGYVGASAAIIAGVKRGIAAREIYESNLQKKNVLPYVMKKWKPKAK